VLTTRAGGAARAFEPSERARDQTTLSTLVVGIRPHSVDGTADVEIDDEAIALLREVGIARTREFERHGVSRTQLRRLRERGDVERIGRGLYTLPGAVLPAMIEWSGMFAAASPATWSWPSGTRWTR